MIKKIFSAKKYMESIGVTSLREGHWARQLDGISVDTIQSKMGNFTIDNEWTEYAEVEPCFLVFLYKSEENDFISAWAKEIDRHSVEWIYENTHYGLDDSWVGEYAVYRNVEVIETTKKYFSVAKWWNYARQLNYYSIEALEDAKKSWADECNGMERKEAEKILGREIIDEWCNIF